MASSAPYARRSFAGGAISTTIPTGMGSGDTSFTIAASTGWSFANDFFVVVDRGLSSEEKIECTGIAGLVVAVAARGADGTSAQAHVAGCTVQVCHVAQDDDEANQVVAAVLGQSSAAKGDLLYMLSAAGPNTLARLPIGSGSQVIGVSAGVPAWVTSPSPTLVAGQAIGVSGLTIAVNGVESVNIVASSAGTTQTLAAVATDIGNDITLQSGDNLTVTMPTATRGAFCYCIVRQPASGTTTNTVTFTGVKWPGGTAPTMTTGASKYDRYDFVSDGTVWIGCITGQNFS
jgi:hypothetical protein